MDCEPVAERRRSTESGARLARDHLPAIISALRAMGWLANATGVGFPFGLRLPGILADPVSLWLVWRILGARVAQPSVRRAVLMLAAVPALILVSGFHGKTEMVMICMICLLLVSVYLSERSSSWAAGAAFGLAASVKIVPVIAAPAILL